MVTMRPEQSPPMHKGGKPAAGRPLLFAVLLVLASAGTLTLLVTGPSLALPLAVTAAIALLGLVVTAWAVAGPRF